MPPGDRRLGSRVKVAFAAVVVVGETSRIETSRADLGRTRLRADKLGWATFQKWTFEKAEPATADKWPLGVPLATFIIRRQRSRGVPLGRQPPGGHLGPAEARIPGERLDRSAGGRPKIVSTRWPSDRLQAAGATFSPLPVGNSLNCCRHHRNVPSAAAANLAPDRPGREISA